MDSGSVDIGSKPASPRRKTLWATLALLLAAAVAAGVTIGPLIVERNDYAPVASIERRADYRDPALIDAAWTLPVAKLYYRPSYEYQTNQSYCGPASLANVLRSTGRAMSQQQVLDGTRYDPWFGVLIGGMTLDEFADLARLRTGGPVETFRGLSLGEFRVLMKSANDPSFRLVVNFHRGPIFGRGHGHFSPILGYLADRDLVLVGDVNAEYRPFLASSDRLWQAANTIDRETGKLRGIVRIEINGKWRARQDSNLRPPA